MNTQTFRRTEYPNWKFSRFLPGAYKQPPGELHYATSVSYSFPADFSPSSNHPIQSYWQQRLLITIFLTTTFLSYTKDF